MNINIVHIKNWRNEYKYSTLQVSISSPQKLVKFGKSSNRKHVNSGKTRASLISPCLASPTILFIFLHFLTIISSRCITSLGTTFVRLWQSVISSFLRFGYRIPDFNPVSVKQGNPFRYKWLKAGRPHTSILLASVPTPEINELQSVILKDCRFDSLCNMTTGIIVSNLLKPCTEMLVSLQKEDSQL